MAAEDKAKDWHRVPNSAAPIIWQEGLEKSRFDEPYRHASKADMDRARELQAEHKAEGQAFARGEIKTTNERL